MKISSASKKVLASALSAAMVVAFTPVVAFAETTQMTDEAALAAGYTVKVVSLTEGASTDVTTKYFTTLQSALAFDTDGGTDGVQGLSGTITLMKDQELEAGNSIAGVEYASGGTFTIDLAGHTISGDVNGALLAPAGGTITIKDSAGTGAITNESKGANAASVSGVVGIEGGTYNKAVSGAIASIKGGTFGGKVTTSATATVTAGTFSAGFESTVADANDETTTTYELILKGGSFKAAGQTDSTKYKAENVYAVKAAGDIQVTAGATVTAEAETTLAETVDAAYDEYEVIDGTGENADDANTYVALGGTSATADQETLKAAWEKGSRIGTDTTLESTAKYIKKTHHDAVTHSGDAFGIYTDGDLALQANGDKGTFATLTSNATANGNDNDAEAIHAVKVTVVKNTVNGKSAAAALTATAAAKGASSAANGSAAAAAVHATGAVDVQGTAALSATAYDDSSYADAINAGGAVSIAAGSYTTDAAENKGRAVYANNQTLTITGGTFVGSLTAKDASAGSAVKGGTFSKNPSAYVAAGFKAYDNGKDYVVGVKSATVAGFNAAVGNNTAEVQFGDEAAATVVAAAQDIVDAIIAGETPAGFAFADEQDASKLTGAITKGTDIATQYKLTKINTRTATDAQKAVVDAVDAYAKKNLSVADVYYTIDLQLTYTAGGKTVVLGTITDLGKTRDKANTVKVKVVDPAVTPAYSSKQGTNTVVAFDGTAVKQLAYVSKEKGEEFVETGATTALAVLENSDELLKDAVINGGETPAPAPEKATQGIDVSKKSLTVKLGAKKTKTAKGKSFNMGASAETELTTAWKSGSTKITVSGDKVKLAKGAKRGTYTAKVSLKAAASDAYLTAAKTITVKFVIK